MIPQLDINMNSIKIAKAKRLRVTPYTSRIEKQGLTSYTTYNHMLLPAGFEDSLVGIASTGSSSIAVGRFSLGRLSGFTRSNNPIAIAVTGKTINSGLTTFPTIQRRGVGWRDTGSVNPYP